MSRQAKTATLVRTFKTPVQSEHKTHEESYEYAVGDKVLKFHAHPTRAWNWVILEGSTLDRKTALKVIDGACDAGFVADDMKVLALQ